MHIDLRHMAALAAVALFATVAVACGGDDDGDANAETSASRTASRGGQAFPGDPDARTATVAAARTAGIDIEATESAAYTAVAQGTAVPGFENVGENGDGDPGDDPPGGGTPDGDETEEPAPTETPPAPGFVATITLDGNPDTPEIDHGQITASVGSTFRVVVVIQDQPRPYQAYQVGFKWDEPTLSFVSEETVKPEGLATCPPASPLEFTTGIYTGCLNIEEPVRYAGPVTYFTMRCEQAGTARLRFLTLAESRGLGTSLLETGGFQFAAEVDEGIQVQCS